MHCDYAFYVGATPANVGALAELERMPGVCGIKAFLGSSTGTLLLSHPDDILAALKAGTRRMAVHSEDEDRLNRAQAFRRARQARNPSGLARCRDRARLHRTRAAGWRKRRAGVCMCCTSPPPMKFRLLAAAKDFATAETTPQHLTLAAPECYERLGTYAQMNPPIRDAQPSRGAVASRE